MKLVIDYLIVGICSLAAVLEIMRVIKLLFHPSFLRHAVFDIPTDKFRLVLLMGCGITILILTILLKLGFI